MKRESSRKNKHPTLWEKIKTGFGRIGTLNIVLIFVGAYMVFINWQMLKVFQLYGSAPETAWCSLIAALLGECGICGWIKTTKEKHKDRQEPQEYQEPSEEIYIEDEMGGKEEPPEGLG